MKKTSIFGVLLALYPWFGGPGLAQEPVIRPAKVATVTATEPVIERTYPASVLPSREVELSFKVSGQVIELPIRAAAEVNEGDIIAQIDTRDFENQITQLQSQRDQSVAQLDALRAGAREEEIASLEAAVASAQAQLDQAREALDRTQQLLDRGVTTRANFEAAEASFRVAEANLVAQEEQLRIGQTGGRPEDIAAAEAALRGIDAQIKVAEDNLADATLTAPFAGIIARRNIENFSNVQAGQPIALLQALNVVHLAFDIPGPDVTAMTRNGPEQITNKAFFDALPGEEFAAEIVEFSVQADSATQTYRGRVAVALPDRSFILPGMIANVVSSTPGDASVLQAPLSAVAAAPDGSAFVWYVDDSGRISARSVTLGAASGALVEIADGVAEGDTIIAAGVSKVVEGMTIRPITTVGN